MRQPAVTLHRERRIDWPRLIANLRSVGMSMGEIARALDIGKTTLRDYASEDLPAEPAFWVGHRLLLLWSERCGCSIDDVPTRRAQLSVSAILKAMR